MTSVLLELQNSRDGLNLVSKYLPNSFWNLQEETVWVPLPASSVCACVCVCVSIICIVFKLLQFVSWSLICGLNLLYYGAIQVIVFASSVVGRKMIQLLGHHVSRNILYFSKFICFFFSNETLKYSTLTVCIFLLSLLLWIPRKI